ncbi:unnamed protein product, partial [Mesorhabditis spiculigera]
MVSATAQSTPAPLKGRLLIALDCCPNCLSHRLSSRCRSGDKLCVACAKEYDDIDLVRHNTILCPKFYTATRAVHEKMKRWRTSDPDSRSFTQQRRRHPPF